MFCRFRSCRSPSARFDSAKGPRGLSSDAITQAPSLVPTLSPLTPVRRRSGRLREGGKVNTAGMRLTRSEQLSAGRGTFASTANLSEPATRPIQGFDCFFSCLVFLFGRPLVGGSRPGRSCAPPRPCGSHGPDTDLTSTASTRHGSQASRILELRRVFAKSLRERL